MSDPPNGNGEPPDLAGFAAHARWRTAKLLNHVVYAYRRQDHHTSSALLERIYNSSSTVIDLVERVANWIRPR